MEQQRERSSSPVPNSDQEHEITELQRQLEHYKSQLDKFRDKLSQSSLDQREIEEEREKTREERR